MPYIPHNRRYVAADAPENGGELNYAITTLVNDFISRRGGMQYAAINEVIGALECAKLELYRRLAAPYENKKNYYKRRRVLSGATR